MKKVPIEKNKERNWKIKDWKFCNYLYTKFQGIRVLISGLLLLLFSSCSFSSSSSFPSSSFLFVLPFSLLLLIGRKLILNFLIISFFREKTPFVIKLLLFTYVLSSNSIHLLSIFIYLFISLIPDRWMLHTMLSNIWMIQWLVR